MKLSIPKYTLLLAALTLPFSKAKGRLGFALGGNNPDGSCKSISDFEADFHALNASTSSNLVRTYASIGAPPVNCTIAANILAAANTTGFKVLLGTWPDQSSWTTQWQALQDAIPGYEDNIYGIAVGSEGLYRPTIDQQGYSATELVAWIQQVQSKFPNIPVGTADTWDSYATGRADPVIEAGPQFLLSNAFPFWSGQIYVNSTASFFDSTLSALAHVQNVSKSVDAIHFMVGETGWPGTAAGAYHDAVGNDKEQASYFNATVCAMLDFGVDVFVFEAFDEPLKGNDPPKDGYTVFEGVWGVFDQERNAKFEAKCG